MKKSDSAPTEKKSRYRDGKVKVTVSIDGDLAEAAKKYFPSTSYGSLSGFIDAKVACEMRARSKRIRKAGVKIPSKVFEK